MKYIKSMLLFIFMSIISINIVNAAPTKFEPTVNMEPEIIDNQISIVLGFKGEHSMALSQYMSYDDDYLTLVDIIGVEDFIITKSNEVYENGYKTIKMLADSDNSYFDTNYAILIFELTDNFKENKQTSMFLYNYEAAGAEKVKVRNKGLELTLKKDETVGMLYLKDEINDKTKIRYWFYSHLIHIGIGVLIVFGLFLLILSIPSKRKKEHREKNISNQIDKENYENHNIEPIKINESELLKMDEKVIEEETVINPFGSVGESKFESIVKEENEKIEEEVNVFANDMPKLSQVNEELEMKVKTTNYDGIVELNDNKEDLVLFQPVFEEDQNDDSKIETLLFFFACLLSISLFIPNIKAFENVVDSLRNAIVGNINYNSTMDYNNDGVLDVIDIIYTKNLENIDYNTDNENSSNTPLFDYDIEDPTTTPDKENQTIIIEPTSNSVSTSATTQKIDDKKTTVTITTTKNVNSNTTKGTTKVSSAAKQKYQVNFKYDTKMSSLSNSSVSVDKGSNATSKLTFKTGYTLDTIVCTNNQSASYDPDNDRVLVSSVNDNTTCTISTKIRTDMEVNFKGSYGSPQTPSVFATFGKSVNVKYSPRKGYKYSSYKCTSEVVGSYNNSTNIFTIPKLTNDTTCHVYFAPYITHDKVQIYNGDEDYLIYNVPGSFVLDTMPTLNLKTNSKYSKVVCNDTNTSKEFTSEWNGSSYVYKFKMKIPYDKPKCYFYK